LNAAQQSSATNWVSLEALVAQALQSNPELNFYIAELAAAKAGRQTAAKLPNPEITVDLGYKRDQTPAGEFLGDGPAWSVSVLQPFELPGRMALRKAIANRQIALAELSLEQFRAELAARVRSLGFKLLAAQQTAEATREVAERVQALLAVLVQRDPAGLTPLLEMRVIEANAVTLQRRLAQAEQAVQLARLDLNLACGLPLEQPTAIAPTNLVLEPLPPLEELLALARTNSLELRLRQAELEQQGFQVELARKERWPRVSLGPFYSRERSQDQETIVGLGLAVPLPVWDTKKTAVQQAQARLQQAETSMRVTQRKIERQVTEHAVTYQRQLAAMARWQTNALEQFRQAAELGDRHYRLGSLPVSTYLELQKQYLDATEALLQTQADALESRQQLELLLGKPLGALSQAPPHGRTE
jgi:cobalt-zinc-cadmium efflux system outer membrane protein